MNDTKTRLQQAEIDRMFVKRFKTLLRDAIELSVKAAGFAIDRIVTESPIMENIVIEPRSSIIPILVICFSRYGEVAVPIKFEGQSFKDIADYVREFLEESGMGDETDSSPDEIVNAVTRHVARRVESTSIMVQANPNEDGDMGDIVPHAEPNANGDMNEFFLNLRNEPPSKWRYAADGKSIEWSIAGGPWTRAVAYEAERWMVPPPWFKIECALRDTTHVVWCPDDEEPLTTAWYDGEEWFYWKGGPKLRSAPSHCMRPEAPTGV